MLDDPITVDGLGEAEDTLEVAVEVEEHADEVRSADRDIYGGPSQGLG